MSTIILRNVGRLITRPISTSVGTCTRNVANNIIKQNLISKKLQENNENKKLSFFSNIRSMIVKRQEESQTVKTAAGLLYESMVLHVDLENFIDVADMPDHIDSWYLVTTLHLWMVSARLMAEGALGLKIRDQIVINMHKDIESRVKRIEEASPMQKYNLKMYYDKVITVFLAYLDYGLEDDKVLAMALFSLIFYKKCNDPIRIECVIHYVRRNLRYLDSLSIEDLKTKFVKFKPLLQPDQLLQLPYLK